MGRLEDNDLRPEIARLVAAGDAEGLIVALEGERIGWPVVMGLTRLGEEAIPALRPALRSEDTWVAGYAAVALAALGDADAEDRLVRLVREYDYSDAPDDAYYLWAAAVSVLGERQTIAAVEPLIAALNAEGGYNVDTRQDAAAALGEIGDTRAIDPLTHRLSIESLHTAFWIAEALERLGGDKAKQAVAAWETRESLGG